MLFNSYIFTLFFLPVTVIGYFALNHYGRNTIAKMYLLCMSLWFYGYFNHTYLFVIMSSIIVNYMVVQAIKSNRNWMFAGLAFDVGMLFYFKYFDFFIENVNALFGTDFNLMHIVLPLGISFFTFQQISYIVDAYRGETTDDSLLDYAVFITFFSQLVAGPIVTHDELIPQIRDKKRQTVNYDNVSIGLMMFAVGLFKKIIVADLFGNLVDTGFHDLTVLSTMDVMLVAFSYTMQIYFDFSAYSDMAIGIGKMFNFEIPVNFNSPYKAYSVPEFWKRWHMTLTRFLTKYIYIPLGGNRKGAVRTYINVMIVFLVSGIWHGAAWTFVIWGALHGLAQVLTKIFQKTYDKINKVIQWIITFTFINATWMVFRAETVENVKLILKQIRTWNFSVSAQLGGTISLDEFDFFKTVTRLEQYTKRIRGFDLIFFFAITFFAVMACRNVQERKYRFNVINVVVTVLLLIWSISSMSGVMNFIYFNF